MSSREIFRRGRQNSAQFRSNQGEKLVVIKANIAANDCSIPVDFSNKGFYSSYTLLTKKPTSLPVTFNDAGRHNLNFLALLTSKLRTLDSDFNILNSPEHRVQRFVGDLGWNGKGEVLVLE